jgi:hypothetical protein
MPWCASKSWAICPTMRPSKPVVSACGVPSWAMTQTEARFPPMLGRASPAPELVWEAGAIHDALYDLVKRQPTRLRTIIIARYGLNGRPVAFYREIGIRLRLSGERVRQLHTEALVMLRHAAHSQHLRSLLGYHTVADYEWAETLAQRWLRKRGGRHG